MLLFYIFLLTECECQKFIEDDCRENPCKSGNCIDLKNDYRCECHSGYSGKNCDKCPSGFAGENCDLPCPVDKPFYHIVDGTCLR